ncbi:MAG: hypothetical protein AAGF66_01970 [Cyanobacteria bacterium P01_H01_bin.119]
MPFPNRIPQPPQDLDRLKLFIYLVPVFGFVPAVWSLMGNRAGREEKAVSRLVVTLAMGWLIAYISMGAGAELSESAALSVRLLVTGSLISTGYFLTNLWLMIRLWRGKSLRLPGVSQLSDRLP